jgi:hypothetical protein
MPLSAPVAAVGALRVPSAMKQLHLATQTVAHYWFAGEAEGFDR